MAESIDGDAWDFYLLLVDGKRASLFVNLGIADRAPLPTHPVMAYVRLFMRLPRQDGLSSDEEFDELKAIEDHLVSGLADGAIFVGRDTTNGFRDFVFYTSASSSWTADVARLMARFPAYSYECDGRDDASWGVYFDFLRPSERQMQQIRNRRTCEALERAGDGLDSERSIRHWAFFESRSDRDRFVARVRERMDAIAWEIDPDPVDSRIGALIEIRGVPSYRSIDDLVLPIFELARECGGIYDGWESEVAS